MTDHVIKGHGGISFNFVNRSIDIINAAKYALECLDIYPNHNIKSGTIDTNVLTIHKQEYVNRLMEAFGGSYTKHR